MLAAMVSAHADKHRENQLPTHRTTASGSHLYRSCPPCDELDHTKPRSHVLRPRMTIHETFSHGAHKRKVDDKDEISHAYFQLPLCYSLEVYQRKLVRAVRRRVYEATRRLYTE